MGSRLFITLSFLLCTPVFAELSFNESHIFELNDVSEEFCGKDKNHYPQINPSYYGCERARKVLYSQAEASWGGLEQR